MAKDVSEFFASENIDHAHLSGHSMAGKVALQRAADNASSIDRLVVADVAPKAPLAHKALLAALKALSALAVRRPATPTARTPDTCRNRRYASS